MVLSQQSIKSSNIIQSAQASNFRAGSYDLSIRDLITHEGKIVDEFVLPPQGVVKVTSEERIILPSNIIGYVLVKTKLCNEGVLALNIGIVDPGFDGPLQSTLINFGKSNVRLRSGDVFSRITFHALDTSECSDFKKIQPINHESLRRSVIGDIDKYLSSTFLDIEKTSEKAAEKAFGDFRSSMFKVLPLIALSVAILTFLLNFGNMWMLYSYLKPQDAARHEILMEKIEAQIKELKVENAELSRKLAAEQQRQAAKLTAARP